MCLLIVNELNGFLKNQMGACMCSVLERETNFQFPHILM